MNTDKEDITARLREASTHALMDVSRTLVREAASEIERLRSVVYAARAGGEARRCAMSDWDRVREEGERISREEGYRVMEAEIAALHAEIESLRMTDAEREAVDAMAQWCEIDGGKCAKNGHQFYADYYAKRAATLRGLLERTAH